MGRNWTTAARLVRLALPTVGSSIAPILVTRPNTRSQSGISKEKDYNDGTIKLGGMHSFLPLENQNA
jgi:hypothetical protein